MGIFLAFLENSEVFQKMAEKKKKDSCFATVNFFLPSYQKRYSVQKWFVSSNLIPRIFMMRRKSAKHFS